jgi:hypothetical protein
VVGGMHRHVCSLCNVIAIAGAHTYQQRDADQLHDLQRYKNLLPNLDDERLYMSPIVYLYTHNGYRDVLQGPCKFDACLAI